jgi:hypothetical protein
MPRWLVVLITMVCFSPPIACLLLMAWPVLLRQPDVAIDSIEMASIAVATFLTGSVLAFYVHRQRVRL